MRHLLRRSASISFAVFISRIFGLIRDIVFTSLFGVSFLSDAFSYAYRIPNLLRLLFGEGALSAALIPIYSRIKERESLKSQIDFATNIIWFISIFLIFTTLIATVFTPYIVSAIAPGLELKTKLLTVNLTRIILPYMLLIGVSSTVISILNYHNYFFLPSLSSAFFNIGIIFTSLMSYLFFTRDPLKMVYIFSAGVVIGGIFQLLINIPLMHKVGYNITLPKKKGKKYLKNLWEKFLPGVIGFGIRQINSYVDLFLASFLIVGSASALTYSYRLMQLSLGIFGVPIWSVILPTFSKQVVKKDFSALSKTLKDGIILVFYVMLPITILMIILGKDYIRVLFFRGAFDLRALEMTYVSFLYYTVGLTLYSINHIFVALFYAFGNTKTPVKISLLIVIINIILNIVLMQYYAHAGLAMATAICAFIYSFLLYVKIHKLFPVISFKSIIPTLIKLVFSTILLFFLIFYISSLFSFSSFSGSLFRLMFIGVLGVISFFTFTLLLKIQYTKFFILVVWKKLKKS